MQYIGMRRRSPQAKPQKLDTILQELLKERKIVVTSEKSRLQHIWRHAVGDRIAAHTSPERLHKDSLFVKVSSPVWMQQLHYLKGEIIEKINGQTEKDFVKHIFFSVGEVPLSDRMPEDQLPFFPESFPLKERDKKMIEKNLAAVSDKELREILQRVMTRDIIRRRLTGTRKAP
jgi:hypothetical protein